LGRIIKKRGKTNLSGKAGTIEFYTIDGVTYFKAHAKVHKKSKSSKAVSGRSNFASVVSLAKAINKVEVLKDAWNNSSLQGRNGYQKLIKYNMPLAYQGNLTQKNLITPKGQNLFIKDFELKEDLISFTFDVYGLIKPPIVIHLFYYFYNNKESIGYKIMSRYAYIEISIDDAAMMRKKGESKYNVMFKVNKELLDLVANYKDVVILLAVTGTPSIAKRKCWTNTVGFDIPLV
jgi:hypothetical protein